VAATKKRNAIASTTPDSTLTASGNIVQTNYIQSMLFCPTYMNHEQDESLPHARNRERIYFRGLSEKFTVQSGNVGDIYHRRICFWSHRRFTQGALIQSSVSPTTYFRPLQWLDTSVPADDAVYTLLFRGRFGIDWTSLLNAPVDTQRVRVVSDRTKKLICRFSAQLPSDELVRNLPVSSSNYKRSIFPNRTITYDDEESGARDGEDPGPSTEGSPWSSEAPTSPGNFYVLDMFSVNGSQDSNAELPEESGTFVHPRIFIDSTVYWHEK